ncbi:MAG TPA: hypothetical protein VN895_00435 [Candidatus Acidoferrum sp.]|jgi:hypothetical protein|nr:hypothetical protein [Candidatus Acidoferrum sp.]
MVNTHDEQSGSLDGLPQDKLPDQDGAEDLDVSSLRVFQLNGRFLYLKGTTDLAEFTAGERRILGALTRQGDTVFVAVAPDPGHVRLCYRLPDLDNAVAFDADGLRSLIQQWFVWAGTAENASA